MKLISQLYNYLNLIKMKKSLFIIGLVSTIGFSSCTNEVVDLNATLETSQELNDSKPQKVGGVANICGANWADARDNYVDGWVIPTGLSSSDNYSTVQSKANTVLDAFQTVLGANTVRLPINPQSVGNSWWDAYKGAIDKASSKGMKVILACWEGTAAKDGKIDDLTQFWNMWNRVIQDYGSNSNVYFEILNEPFGYTLSQWTTICNQWLTTYPSIPRGRILIGGTGYDDNVSGVGADSRFSNCLLSRHIYTWWGNYTSTSQWESSLNDVNPYASRTVITEFGAPMSTSKNYSSSINNDAEIAFMQGVTNKIRNSNIGCCYWPGLRGGDNYSILNESTLQTNNVSGIEQLRWAYNTTMCNPSLTSGSYYKITNKNSSKVIEMPQSTTAYWAAATQYTWNGTNTQQWQVGDQGSGYFKLTNKNSVMVLELAESSTTAGANVTQYTWNGSNTQQWKIEYSGLGYYKLINRNSGLAMDVNGASTANDANIIQWYWSGGNNQLWQFNIQ